MQPGLRGTAETARRGPAPDAKQTKKGSLQMIYRHKKSGGLYRVLTGGTDCTNSRDGTEVVVYMRLNDERIIRPVYVREAAEFFAKFEEQPSATEEGPNPLFPV
jgi:hypothetical protein